MATWTNQTKDAATFTDMSMSGLSKWGDPVATWGNAVVVWGGDARAVWADNTKHTSTFTDQVKH